MDKTEKSLELDMTAVRRLVVEAIAETSLRPMLPDLRDVLGGGRMLRARLAVSVGAAHGAAPDVYRRVAAVAELIHAASLLHDDVIDGGDLRRGAPSFWARKGTAGAIILGDLLVCRAIRLACGSGDLALVSDVARFSEEMCDSEAQQELITRHQPPAWEICLSIARRKTGALFALAASAAAPPDTPLRAALREAGYAVGTAYQLADDLLDASGDSEQAGKVLGRDALRAKVTAFSAWRQEVGDPRERIAELCDAAERLLTPWPPVRDAWRTYMQEDMTPRIERFVANFSLESVV